MTKIYNLAVKADGIAKHEEISSIINICKDYFKEQEIKEKGGYSLFKRTKAAKKYIKDIPEGQPHIKGAIMHEKDGWTFQILVNGYCGVMLNEPLDIEPILDEETRPNFEVDKVFALDGQKKIKQPFKPADVKVHKKTVRAKEKAGEPMTDTSFKVGEYRYQYEYLIDCCNILGGKIKAFQLENENMGGEKRLFLKSENGRAVIYPMRR